MSNSTLDNQSCSIPLLHWFPYARITAQHTIGISKSCNHYTLGLYHRNMYSIWGIHWFLWLPTHHCILLIAIYYIMIYGLLRKAMSWAHVWKNKELIQYVRHYPICSEKKSENIQSELQKRAIRTHTPHTPHIKMLNNNCTILWVYLQKNQR